MKSQSPAADTRSPWTDAFRAAPESNPAAEHSAAGYAATRADDASPAEAPHPTSTPSGFDREADAWASEALFDSYND
ncbi:MAG: hypothetical protein HY260_18475 [Chloroflexi bacterium]|nr:hypothetical protein [Chloroflexota bacterium]